MLRKTLPRKDRTFTINPYFFNLILAYRTLQWTFTFIPNIIPGRIQGSRQTWWRYVLVNVIQGVRCCTITITICIWKSWNIQNISVYSPHVSETVWSLVHGLLLAACFLESIRPDEILAHVLQRVFARVRILARVFEGVFVRGRILVPCFERVSVFVRGRILAPCFWEGIRPWMNTCLMFLRGYSSVGRMLAPCLREGILPSTNICLTNRIRSQRIRRHIRICIRAGCANLSRSWYEESPEKLFSLYFLRR